MIEVIFDVMQSCAIAAAVVLIGRAIVKRVKFFQTYCIPGVIVCGLLVSLVLGLLRGNNILLVNWNVAVLKEWFMDIFFTGVGLTASWKLIKKGGAKLRLLLYQLLSSAPMFASSLRTLLTALSHSSTVRVRSAARRVMVEATLFLPSAMEEPL